MKNIFRSIGVVFFFVCSVQSAFAGPTPINLVKNGDFENSTANDLGTFPASAGGIGQIQLGSPTAPTKALVVTLAEWTKAEVAADGSDGFAFVINADADNKNAGSAYPNQGGGFRPNFHRSLKPTFSFGGLISMGLVVR